MHWILLTLIRFYTYFLSPLLGVNCRFTPSCSNYAHDAIKAHGIFRGSLLAVRRLLRCHPFGAHGHDPVPPAEIAAGEQEAI